MKTSRLLAISAVCTLGLSSCALFEEDRVTTYRSYGYERPDYAAGDSSGGGASSSASPSQSHAYQSRRQAPVRHRNADKTWVNSQNPMGYTIELADEDQPTNVAGKIHSAPKSNRSAQVEYQRGGKKHYKGVFGSFQSKEAADKAFQSLPDDVKSGAKVKSWGSVQGNVNN